MVHDNDTDISNKKSFTLLNTQSTKKNNSATKVLMSTTRKSSHRMTMDGDLIVNVANLSMV